MRIFYAVTFSNETKEALIPYRDIVANSSVKGHFVDKKNFHLTLEFIGEVTSAELQDHLLVLESLAVPHFKLNATYIGSFQKRDRHVVWMGIEMNPPLMELQRQLIRKLRGHGFRVEDRTYKPHITLGRQILLLGDLEELIINPLMIKPHSIAIMESKKVGDQLVYEPISELLLG